jgi:hypothetical protein
MKRFLKVMGILSIAMVLVVGLSYGQAKQSGKEEVKIAASGTPNPEPPKPGPEDDTGNKDEFAATPNLSFPIIATDILQMFYQQTWVDSDGDGVVDESEWVIDYDLNDDGVNEMTEPTPIEVTEVINVQYGGSYPGNEDAFFSYYTLGEDGCATDINGDGIVDDLDLTSESMLTWLQSMQPWYDQPVTTTDTDPNLIWNADYVDAANSWQADWLWTGTLDNPEVITIDFIDWGNPLENTVYPIVGMRFPVEVALYAKLETPMTAYKMGCLEYPSSKEEIFGTSVKPSPDAGSFTYDSYFATVLTNKFFCEVWNPNGTITKIPVEPGIGPSGKMNFASAGGGWIPTVAGWHRIWLHLNDPLISLSGAIVNNDEHYIMSTGCMVQGLNKNKQALVGIIGDSTFIDVLVKLPNGGKIK